MVQFCVRLFGLQTGRAPIAGWIFVSAQQLLALLAQEVLSGAAPTPASLAWEESALEYLLALFSANAIHVQLPNSNPNGSPGAMKWTAEEVSGFFKVAIGAIACPPETAIACAIGRCVIAVLHVFIRALTQATDELQLQTILYVNHQRDIRTVCDNALLRCNVQPSAKLWPSLTAFLSLLFDPTNQFAALAQPQSTESVGLPRTLTPAGCITALFDAQRIDLLTKALNKSFRQSESAARDPAETGCFPFGCISAVVDAIHVIVAVSHSFQTSSALG